MAEFEPLFQAEYRRMGISEEDSMLINSGWSAPITRERLADVLAHLRLEPTGIGIRDFFAKLGVDYDDIVRPLDPDE